MKMNQLKDDSGSIVIGLIVIVAITITATSLLALMAYQSATLAKRQQRTEAQQAAYNAYVLAAQNLSAATPTGNAPYSPPSFIPTAAGAWTATELNSVTNRWWITPDATDISTLTVHAEGRSGPTGGVVSGYTVTMRYSYATGRWTVTDILPTVDGAA